MVMTETTKSTKKTSLKSSILKQALLFLLLVVLLLVGLRLFMKSYTQHGTQILVDDYREMTLSDAKQKIKKQKLQYSIQDSSYNAELAPGTIIDQNPKPNSAVKKKRTVYFVINSSSAPPVKMPNLIDNSLRQAELQLNNLGLKVGKVSYQPDIANAVLAQKYNGKVIKPGTEILKGQLVDLVIGDGFGNRTMIVPNLLGLEYAEALIAISDAGLRVGNLVKQGDITDLNSATIIEQVPTSSSGQTLRQGQSIDLYVIENPN